MVTLIKVTALAAVLLLSGCAFAPGTPLFDAVALHYDRSDPCQAGTTPERRAQLGRPEGYQRPDWCFSGRDYQKPIYLYNNSGQRIATVK
jgi:hypothetical protein